MHTELERKLKRGGRQHIALFHGLVHVRKPMLSWRFACPLEEQQIVRLFALSVVCLLQLQRRYATAGVLVSRCGSSRLCQARDMILRAKAALDNKAKAELMLLKVRAPCGPHRALRLLRAPSDRFRAWQSGQGSGMRVAAALVVDKPRGKAREQDLAMLPAKPAAHAGAAPRTGAAAQEQIGEQERDDDSRSAKAEDAPITQADLKRFVDETLQKERALAAGAPGLPAADRRAGAGGPAGLSSYSNAGLAHHPTWYDTHTGWGGSWHQNHWCYDNPQWHGPFGDPCVAYATGGDRQFWCEWDGAGADNACPRSCGTCSWRSYYKDETSHERKEHLLHEHFDPQEPPPEAPGQEQAQPKESGKGGPVEPKRVAQRRSMTGALLKQVLEMKHRLMEVAKATRAVATEVALSRTNNHHLSSGQAAADLANFFQDKQAKVAHKSGESDSSAIQDLISFFDHEPGGMSGLAPCGTRSVGAPTFCFRGINKSSP